MRGADTGYVGKAHELRRFEADDTVEHAVLLVDQNRIAKAQTADRGHDLRKVSLLNLAHVACRDDEVFRRTLDKLEFRHEIVANGMRSRRGGGELCQLLAPIPAFRHESVLQRVTREERFAMIGGHFFSRGLCLLGWISIQAMAHGSLFRLRVFGIIIQQLRRRKNRRGP